MTCRLHQYRACSAAVPGHFRSLSCVRTNVTAIDSKVKANEMLLWKRIAVLYTGALLDKKWHVVRDASHCESRINTRPTSSIATCMMSWHNHKRCGPLHHWAPPVPCTNQVPCQCTARVPKRFACEDSNDRLSGAPSKHTPCLTLLGPV